MESGHNVKHHNNSYQNDIMDRTIKIATWNTNGLI